ncbi:MAG TPA: tripartite tricarboxylate transporter TctB family protein [Selenomonadales bacterium]|nr:tripartite tricarboxylate transporter TctB family protein [Selenomonadales bacterium]
MMDDRLSNFNTKVSVLFAMVLILSGGAGAFVIVNTLQLTDSNNVFGPGFYPLILCIMLLLTSFYLLYQLLYGNSESVVIKEVIDKAAAARSFSLLALIIVAVLAMPFLGFIVAMFGFSFIQMTFLDRNKQPLRWRIIYPAVISGGIYWLFTSLSIPLPVPFWLN